MGTWISSEYGSIHNNQEGEKFRKSFCVMLRSYNNFGGRIFGGLWNFPFLSLQLMLYRVRHSQTSNMVTLDEIFRNTAAGLYLRYKKRKVSGYFQLRKPLQKWLLLQYVGWSFTQTDIEALCNYGSSLLLDVFSFSPFCCHLVDVRLTGCVVSGVY